MDPNPFETANAGFAQVVYEEFLRDPGSVSPEWRRLFESGVVGLTPSEPNARETPVEPDAGQPSEALPEGVGVGGDILGVMRANVGNLEEAFGGGGG